MTITAPLVFLAQSATAHPWSTIALVLVVGVVFPAIWSRHSWRRNAAAQLIRTLLDAITRLVTAFRGAHRT